MTVTIAALCDANNDTQTGNFIMCADTLVSYCSKGVPLSGNLDGLKIYDLPHGFYVAIADDISRSHQVVRYLYHQMQSFQVHDPRLVDLIELTEILYHRE
jgi:hypothetical protein